jgi:hypothetical protein
VSTTQGIPRKSPGPVWLPAGHHPGVDRPDFPERDRTEFPELTAVPAALVWVLCEFSAKALARGELAYHARFRDISLVLWTLFAVSISFGFFVPYGIAAGEDAAANEDVIEKVATCYPQKPWADTLREQGLRKEGGDPICYSGGEASRPNRWDCYVATLQQQAYEHPPRSAQETSQAKPLLDSLRTASQIGETDPLRAPDHRLRVDGFAQNAQQHIFTWLFFFMGVLLCVLRPCSADTLIEHKKAWLRTSYLMMLVVRWPHWWRWLQSDDDSRRIFSYAHIDLFPGSGLYNEAQSYLFFVLAAGIATAWSTNEAREPTPGTLDGLGAADILNAAERVTQAFLRFQVSSVLLGAAFAYATAVYWRLIWIDGDRRYLVSAVLVHGLWLYLWGALSLPLVSAVRSWRAVRRRIVLELHRPRCQPPWAAPSHGNSAASDREWNGITLELIERARPVHDWQAFGTAVVAVLSFLAPGIQALLRD